MGLGFSQIDDPLDGQLGGFPNCNDVNRFPKSLNRFAPSGRRLPW